jgi:Domain of unknown function (DUF4281)
MTYDALFIGLSWAVVPAWVMLVLSPWWSAARKWVHSGLYPFAYAILYLGFGIMALATPGPAATVDLTTLAGLKALFFERTETLLLSWAHILAWDLFVGAWIDRDAIRRNVGQWMRIGCILLTYLLGPAGLLAYLVSRKMTGKGGFGLSET